MIPKEPSGLRNVDAEAVRPPSQRVQGEIAIEVDTSLFPVEAVLAAAYKFTDRSYVYLFRTESAGDGLVAILAAQQPEMDLENLRGEFCNELVDQALRVRLEDRFGAIRTLLVAQAFSEGNLLDEQRDDGDYQRDSRGAGQHR